MELILLCAGRSRHPGGSSGTCCGKAPTDPLCQQKVGALLSPPASPFGAEDAAHVARFTNARCRRLRHEARCLLWYGLQYLYGRHNLHDLHDWGRCPDRLAGKRPGGLTDRRPGSVPDTLPDGLPNELADGLAVMPQGLTLHHDALGSPFFNDARLQCSISYARDQAFCLLGLTEHGVFPRLGLDCEELRFTHLPPLSVFSQREQQELATFLQLQKETKENSSSLSNQSLGQELSVVQKTLASSCLRRWCVREALLKAHGTGLRLKPSSLDAGFQWQRCGVQHIEGHSYAWRCLSLQGLVLCLAIEERSRALLHQLRLVRVDMMDRMDMSAGTSAAGS